MGGGLLYFTKLMLISTQVEVLVEVGVELGKREKTKCSRLSILVGPGMDDMK